ncbi:BTB/POZ domain-containing protein KCTD12b [Stigmatopora nigra]
MALPDSSISTEELPFPEIVELNVGGQVYITRYSTLTSVPGSLLWEMFSRKSAKGLARDTKGRFFVDRDGFLFRYILDYMRDQQLVLPDHFPERGRLQREAEFFNLPELVKQLAPKISKQNSLGDDGCPSDPEDSSPGADLARNLSALSAVACATGPPPASLDGGKTSGFITIGYRGSYTLGRDSHTDAKFRRVARIMVCGKTSLAKEVFGETLNESRDPDRPPERYTSRYYLKFTFLEQAFDKLADAGFHMVACNSTGTCAFAHEQTDDKIWTSYTEYVFYRGSSVIPKANTTPDFQTLPEETPLQIEAEWSSAEPNSTANISNSSRTQSLPESSSLPIPDIQPPPLPKSPPLTPLPPSFPPGSPELPPPPPSVLLLPPPSPTTASPPSTPPCPKSPNRPNDRNLKTLPRLILRENGGPPVGVNEDEEERKMLEEDLKKCIDDFKKIRMPKVFPDRKRHWQNDLLKKYNA